MISKQFLLELFRKREDLVESLAAVDKLIQVELRKESVNFNLKNEAENNQKTDEYPLNGSWRRKIIFLLTNAGEKGMTRSEIIEQLKRYHSGSWTHPAIGAQLQHMYKENKIEKDKSNGQNIYRLTKNN